MNPQPTNTRLNAAAQPDQARQAESHARIIATDAALAAPRRQVRLRHSPPYFGIRKGHGAVWIKEGQAFAQRPYAVCSCIGSEPPPLRSRSWLGGQFSSSSMSSSMEHPTLLARLKTPFSSRATAALCPLDVILCPVPTLHPSTCQKGFQCCPLLARARPLTFTDFTGSSATATSMRLA